MHGSVKQPASVTSFCDVVRCTYNLSNCSSVPCPVIIRHPASDLCKAFACQVFNGMSVELEGSPQQRSQAMQKLQALPQVRYVLGMDAPEHVWRTCG